MPGAGAFESAFRRCGRPNPGTAGAAGHTRPSGKPTCPRCWASYWFRPESPKGPLLRPLLGLLGLLGTLGTLGPLGRFGGRGGRFERVVWARRAARLRGEHDAREAACEAACEGTADRCQGRFQGRGASRRRRSRGEGEEGVLEARQSDEAQAEAAAARLGEAAAASRKSSLLKNLKNNKEKKLRFVLVMR